MKLGKPEVKPRLLEALYDLTQGQTMNVAMRDEVKTDTFNLMGIDPDTLGVVSSGAKAGTKIADKLISACFSELKKEGLTTSPLRNRYALTDAGLNWCMSQSFTLPNGGPANVVNTTPVATPVATPVTLPSPEPTTAQVAVTVAPKPVAHVPKAKPSPKAKTVKTVPLAIVSNPTTDPYIKSLMVQNSPCYGVSPSTRAKTCKSSPQFSDCQTERNSRLRELASSLEAQAALLEVIDFSAEIPQEEPAAAATLPADAIRVPIDVDGMECAHCKSPIAVGQDAVILKGSGIFHPECATLHHNAAQQQATA